MIFPWIKNLSTDDFAAIEAEMRKVVKENQTFERMSVSREEALELCRSGRLGALSERAGESVYKTDLLSDIPEGEEISIYKNGDFWDLCAGPHVGRTGNCKAFKLMSIASAFYKGDKERGSLQRIYGTCFKNKTQLAEHLEKLEEAKKRDHRRLGREMGLFHIDEAVGQGLVLWKPKGALVRRALQDFITEELDAQGYSQVFTPHIGKLDLYRALRALSLLSGQPVSPYPGARGHGADGGGGLLLRRAEQRLGKRRGRGLPPQAHELPAPHQDFCQRPPQLP